MSDDWAGFAAEVAAESRPQRKGCSVGLLVRSLTEEQRQQIEDALARPELTHAAIHAALKRRLDPKNLPSAFTIGRHRRKGCNCHD